MPEVDSPETAKRIFRASRAWILERSIGVYTQMRGGNPVMAGSGILLMIADAAFVVSAGHVLQTAKDAAILIGPMTPNSQTVGFAATVNFSADLDRVDVGFARLSDSVATELVQYGKKFARLSDLDVGREPTKGFYSVVGYPAKTNSADYQTKRVNVLPLCYGTYLYAGTVDDVTPGVTIVVGWTQDSVLHPDGEMGRMPSLKGISGCGMWRLYGIGDRIGHLETWDSSWIRLAGIEHTWVDRKYVKGTMIRCVLDLIEEAHPDLRRSIRLTLP